MIHAREDYNRIQDPKGLIPQDEPVFLLRGQDRFTPRMLALYRRLLIAEGNRLLKISRNKGLIWETVKIYESQAQKLFDMANMVKDHNEKVEEWQRECKRKTPDV